MNDRSSEANSKTLAIAEKRRKQKRRNVIIMSVMAGTAYFLRFKGVLFGGVMSTDLMDILGYLRPSLYVAIYLYWRTTIKRRIVQDQVRVCLESIAYLFIIRFIFRTIKFNIQPYPSGWTGWPQIPVPEENYAISTRILWYLYYVPILMIPAIETDIAISVGRPGNWHFPKWTMAMPIVSFTLLVLVLANDSHHLMFIPSVPGDYWTDSDGYGYGPLMLPVAAWVVILNVATLFILAARCRLPQKNIKIILPAALDALILFYSGLYFYGIDWVKDAFGDYTAFYCFLTALMLESCILRRYVMGMTYDEIAEELKITPSGVRWNLDQIVEKCGFANKNELLTAAIESKLIVTTLKD